MSDTEIIQPKRTKPKMGEKEIKPSTPKTGRKKENEKKNSTMGVLNVTSTPVSTRTTPRSQKGTPRPKRTTPLRPTESIVKKSSKTLGVKRSPTSKQVKRTVQKKRSDLVKKVKTNSVTPTKINAKTVLKFAKGMARYKGETDDECCPSQNVSKTKKIVSANGPSTSAGVRKKPVMKLTQTHKRMFVTDDDDEKSAECESPPIKKKSIPSTRKKTFLTQKKVTAETETDSDAEDEDCSKRKSSKNLPLGKHLKKRVKSITKNRSADRRVHASDGNISDSETDSDAEEHCSKRKSTNKLSLARHLKKRLTSITKNRSADRRVHASDCNISDSDNEEYITDGPITPSSDTRQRRPYWQPDELTAMLQACNARRHLLRGKFESTWGGKAGRKRAWEEVAAATNVVSIFNRTAKECKKKVGYYMSKAKSKNSKLRKIYGRTGAGAVPENAKLTPTDILVLDYVGEQPVLGVNGLSATPLVHIPETSLNQVDDRESGVGWNPRRKDRTNITPKRTPKQKKQTKRKKLPSPTTSESELDESFYQSDHGGDDEVEIEDSIDEEDEVCSDFEGNNDDVDFDDDNDELPDVSTSFPKKPNHFEKVPDFSTKEEYESEKNQLLSFLANGCPSPHSNYSSPLEENIDLDVEIGDLLQVSLSGNNNYDNPAFSPKTTKTPVIDLTASVVSNFPVACTSASRPATTSTSLQDCALTSNMSVKEDTRIKKITPKKGFNVKKGVRRSLELDEEEFKSPAVESVHSTTTSTGYVDPYLKAVLKDHEVLFKHHEDNLVTDRKMLSSLIEAMHAIKHIEDNTSTMMMSWGTFLKDFTSKEQHSSSSSMETAPVPNIKRPCQLVISPVCHTDIPPVVQTENNTQTESVFEVIVNGSMLPVVESVGGIAIGQAKVHSAPVSTFEKNNLAQSPPAEEKLSTTTLGNKENGPPAPIEMNDGPHVSMEDGPSASVEMEDGPLASVEVEDCPPAPMEVGPVATEVGCPASVEVEDCPPAPMEVGLVATEVGCPASVEVEDCPPAPMEVGPQGQTPAPPIEESECVSVPLVLEKEQASVEQLTVKSDVAEDHSLVHTSNSLPTDNETEAEVPDNIQGVDPSLMEPARILMELSQIHIENTMDEHDVNLCMSTSADLNPEMEKEHVEGKLGNTCTNGSCVPNEGQMNMDIPENHTYTGEVDDLKQEALKSVQKKPKRKPKLVPKRTISTRRYVADVKK